MQTTIDWIDRMPSDFLDTCGNKRKSHHDIQSKQTLSQYPSRIFNSRQMTWKNRLICAPWSLEVRLFATVARNLLHRPLNSFH